MSRPFSDGFGGVPSPRRKQDLVWALPFTSESEKNFWPLSSYLLSRAVYVLPRLPNSPVAVSLRCVSPPRERYEFCSFVLSILLFVVDDWTSSFFTAGGLRISHSPIFQK